MSGNPILLVMPRTVLIPLFVSFCNMPVLDFCSGNMKGSTGGMGAGLMGWQTGSDKNQMTGSLWPHITDKEVHFGTSFQEFVLTLFSHGAGGCSPIMPVALLVQPGVFLRLFPCCPPPPPRSSTSTCPVTTALGCVFLNCHRLQLARPSS